ncbi:PRA1 family protein-domain-containing protein [Halteromyces radiatus]|uniref:PRA1 family protein-domain-containing protein n=1 Tax=Halteromyces radiatus TaxID=101107 RepID=UPI00221F1197|nr:PRA1 family protein-domain-containing protein [Halteromyces radiatus]KAI8099246.1 PRA1 family protein-domain-containing protein [Halteromyces radiatus]
MSKPLLSTQTAQQLGESISAIGNADNDERFSFLRKFREDRLSNVRPVTDFFDKNRINFTSSFPTITKRWNYNLNYFSANYMLIMVALSIYAIITNWWLLFTVAFIIGGFYLISRISGPGLEIGGNTIPSSTLYATYAGGSFLLLLFSGATGAVFWVLGAGALLILGHAAIIEPGIEGDFADEQV